VVLYTNGLFTVIEGILIRELFLMHFGFSRKQVAAVMMVYQKTNSSEEIMKMDMENERKTFSKGLL